jgi:hypothetical protein
MRSRQRGMAHVNIFVFVVTLVLFLGAVTFAFVLSGKVDEVERENLRMSGELKKQIADLKIRDHLLDELKTIVGEPGDYTGREGFDYQGAYGSQPKLADVPVPAKLREALKKFGKDANVPDAQSTHLGSLIASATSTIKALTERANDFESKHRVALGETDALRTKQNEFVAAGQTAITKYSEDQAQLRSWMDSEFKKKDGEITGLQDAVAKGRQALEAAQTEHGKALLAATKEKDLLSAQNRAMVSRISLVNPPQQLDGRVISSSQAAGLAYIDLGRKDMLQAGTVFRVQAPGSDAIKAYGTVTKVDHDRAEIRISELRDRFQPVVRGDELRNDLYSPGLKRTIVLIGRFNLPLTKPLVKAMLEQLGNTVVDQPAPGIDLAIIGENTVNASGDAFTDISDTEEYKKCLFLGCEIVPLHKVRDFLRATPN